MPESRHRTKHHHTVPHQKNPSNRSRTKPRRSAAFVFAILTAILGLAVVYFTMGSDFVRLFIGTTTGAIIGYFVGRAMDKSFQTK